MLFKNVFQLTLPDDKGEKHEFANIFGETSTKVCALLAFVSLTGSGLFLADGLGAAFSRSKAQAQAIVGIRSFRLLPSFPSHKRALSHSTTPQSFQSIFVVCDKGSSRS